MREKPEHKKCILSQGESRKKIAGENALYIIMYIA